MTSRYQQLLSIIDSIRPTHIVEVGVHRALRADAMTKRALRYGPVRYTGFDVFDTRTQAFHDEAMNGKGIATERDARLRLDLTRRTHGGFDYILHVGDTRDTLHRSPLANVDLAFIDGDHRLAVIREDYAALSSARCVVFDDYLLPGPGGEMPDTSHFGANLMISELQDDPTLRVEVLPARDQCRPGWYAALAAVYRQ